VREAAWKTTENARRTGWSRPTTMPPSRERKRAARTSHRGSGLLWNAARVRQQQIAAIFGPNPANTLEGRAKRLHLANRPVFLLSGLLTFGCCGGKFGIITPNRYGCLNHHRRGVCDNNRTITRDKIEARVLSGLKDRLVSSEAVGAAIRAYAEDRRLSRRLRGSDNARLGTDARYTFAPKFVGLGHARLGASHRWRQGRRHHRHAD
jgi:hypothetical protein